MNVITNHWPLIAAAVAVLATVFLGAEGSLRDKVFALLYYAVLKAEAEFGGKGKTGAVKKAAVAAWVRRYLPPALRLFVTEAMIDRLIEQAVEKMKEMLAEHTDIDLAELVNAFKSYL